MSRFADGDGSDGNTYRVGNHVMTEHGGAVIQGFDAGSLILMTDDVTFNHGSRHLRIDILNRIAWRRDSTFDWRRGWPTAS